MRARLGVGSVLAITGVAIVMLHTAVAGIVFSVVATRTVATWEARIGEVIRETLAEELNRVAAIREGLSGDAARDALGRRMDGARFAVVLDREERVLYWYVAGDSWVERGIPEGPASYDEALKRLGEALAMHRLDGTAFPADPSSPIERLLAASPMAVAIENYDGRRYGTLVAGSLELATDRTARAVVRSALTGLAFAVAIAAAVGLVAIGTLAAGADRAARGLESTLETLALGDYGAAVPRFRILQFDRIAASAASLVRALEREHELRQRWARDIAHDLRTPLTALRAQLAGISEGVFAPSPDRLARVERQLRSMESLVADFLLLTRLEAPEFVPERAATAPAALIETVVTRFAEDLRAEGRPLEIVVAPELPACPVDPRLMERALANLAENARVHGEGAVEVSAQRYGDAIRFTVRNHGSIDPAIADRLLERSVRGNGRAAGHGLGLSIAAAVAAAHGGTLSVEARGGVVTAELRVPCSV